MRDHLKNREVTDLHDAKEFDVAFVSDVIAVNYFKFCRKKYVECHMERRNYLEYLIC